MAATSPADGAGDRASLTAYVRRLEALLDEADPREAPGLTRELRALRRDLRELAEPAEGSTVDALAAKRAARRAGTAAS